MAFAISRMQEFQHSSGHHNDGRRSCVLCAALGLVAFNVHAPYTSASWKPPHRSVLEDDTWVQLMEKCYAKGEVNCLFNDEGIAEYFLMNFVPKRQTRGRDSDPAHGNARKKPRTDEMEERRVCYWLGSRSGHAVGWLRMPR
jgi:hypothetical protein